MKKITLFVFFIVLMSLTLHSQESNKRFYIRAGGGFGIGLCYYDPCDYYKEDNHPTYDNLKSLKFVPGQGFNFDVGAGYMFTKNIGVQLSVKDFLGLPIKGYSNNYIGESNSRTENFQYSGMMFQVIPSVVLDLGLDKIDPYARFGMSIGAGSRVKYKETQEQNGTSLSIEGKYTGNIPLGYSAALGLKFKMNDKFSLFGEFDCNGINYTPKKYIMTKYSVNGVDRLSTLPLSLTETDFVKDYDASGSTSSDSPAKQLKQTFPFSNFEINIGAAYRF